MQVFNLAHVKIKHLPPLLTYAIGLLPAFAIFYATFSGNTYADPVKELRNTLGIWALRFLIAALLITPLRKLFGLNLLRYRRQMGVLAFIYVALHLLTYIALDKGFTLSPIIADIIKRPYITIGMISFIILLPLALTSNNASIKRMGAKWNSLHKWVYGASVLGVIHYIMIKKTWASTPLIYLAIILGLIALRLIRARPTAQKEKGRS